jgi:hypothetical protein
MSDETGVRQRQTDSKKRQPAVEWAEQLSTEIIFLLSSSVISVGINMYAAKCATVF